MTQKQNKTIVFLKKTRTETQIKKKKNMPASLDPTNNALTAKIRNAIIATCSSSSSSQSSSEEQEQLQKLLQQPDSKDVPRAELQNTITATLHFACCLTDLPLETLRTLLKTYVQMKFISRALSQMNTEGHTALRKAAANTNKQLIQLLVAFFPSDAEFKKVVEMRTGFGYSVTDVAKSNEIRDLLQEPKCWLKCVQWYREIYAEEPNGDVKEEKKADLWNMYK